MHYKKLKQTRQSSKIILVTGSLKPITKDDTLVRHQSPYRRDKFIYNCF